MFRSSILAASLACLAAVAAAQQAGPVAVLVKVFPSAGREDELQSLYLKRLDYLRKAEPEATFRPHRDKDANTFLWYEVYPSQAALRKSPKGRDHPLQERIRSNAGRHHRKTLGVRDIRRAGKVRLIVPKAASRPLRLRYL